LFLHIATGTLITKVSEATAKDVDIAVEAAQKAFETTWGLNAPGSRRGELLNKLALLMEQHADELAALESLDNGESNSNKTSPLLVYTTYNVYGIGQENFLDRRKTWTLLCLLVASGTMLVGPIRSPDRSSR
jgi:hypothetical protein